MAVEDDAKNALHNQYLATCLYAVGQMMCGYLGGTWGMPKYTELMYPELQQKEDKRTSKEIRSDLIAKLGGDTG